MTYLVLCLLFALAFGAWILYDKYLIPQAEKTAQNKLDRKMRSTAKEISQVEQSMKTMLERAETLLEHTESIDPETVKLMSVGQLAELGDDHDKVVKTLGKVQASLSKRAQNGTTGNLIKFFTAGGNKQNTLTSSAETAGFYGPKGINTFLTRVSETFPSIKNAKDFLALDEEKRAAIVRRVKSNNVP